MPVSQINCLISLWFRVFTLKMQTPNHPLAFVTHSVWYRDNVNCLCGVGRWFNMSSSMLTRASLCWLCWLYHVLVMFAVHWFTIYTSVGMGVMICFIVCVEWASGLTLSLSRAFSVGCTMCWLCWLYLGFPIYISVTMGVMICFIVCVQWASGLTLSMSRAFLCWLYLGSPIYISVGMGVMICFIVCVEWVSGLTLSLSRACCVDCTKCWLSPVLILLSVGCKHL